MQRELDSLMESTKADKIAWQKREADLLGRLEAREDDINHLRQKLRDQDLSRLESMRKDHVIENMQTTFTMVLTRAMQKMRKCLEMPKTTHIPTARMEICMDDLLRTFQLEIDTLQSFFRQEQPPQDATEPGTITTLSASNQAYSYQGDK